MQGILTGTKVDGCPTTNYSKTKPRAGTGGIIDVRVINFTQTSGIYHASINSRKTCYTGAHIGRITTEQGISWKNDSSKRS